MSRARQSRRGPCEGRVSVCSLYIIREGQTELEGGAGGSLGRLPFAIPPPFFFP